MKTTMAFHNRCIQRCIVLLQILYLGYYLNYSSTVFNNDILMIFALFIICTGLVSHIMNSNGCITPLMCAAIFGSLWSVLCTIFNGSGLGSALTQTCVLLSICLFSESSFSFAKWKRMVLRMALILIVILSIFSKTDLYGIYHYPVLSYFNAAVRINPNCIALLWFFFLIYVVQFIEVSINKIKLKRFLQIASGAIIAWRIWSTDSRTSIFAGFAFIALLIIFQKKLKITNKKIYLLALMVSILIPLIYVWMYNSGIMIGTTLGGKGFYSGRETIWTEVFKRVMENPVFGSSNKLDFNGILSTHHSLLAILCYYGFIGLACSIAVIYKAFKNLHPVNNALPMLAILCATFVMCFETMMTDWSLVWPFCFLFIRVEEKKQHDP